MKIVVNKGIGFQERKTAFQVWSASICPRPEVRMECKMSSSIYPSGADPQITVIPNEKLISKQICRTKHASHSAT